MSHLTALLMSEPGFNGLTDLPDFPLFDVGYIRRIGRLLFCDRWQMRRVRVIGFCYKYFAPNGALIEVRMMFPTNPSDGDAI
jgi:hypothetical protein